jgi:predicted dehydrogenase
MGRVRLAVVGAGLIGRRHIEEVVASSHAALAAIVNPGEPGPGLAARYGVPLYRNMSELFATDKPDGVILATPNQLHVDGGLECVSAGVPVIVEKPIGDAMAGARKLVEAGEAAGVTVLTGHHRNYSPIVAKAREIVRSGQLGQIVAVTGTALFAKPDDYFDFGGGWRRQAGGGPILLNLIHEVNVLQSLVGEILRVQAVTTNANRGFAVEDTAATVFTFAGGALGTFLLSDTAASPRSGEQTSAENADYANYGDEDCYHIAGTAGSLSLPTMRLKTFAGNRSWYTPFESSVIDVDRTDPLANQISHFCQVIRGAATPVCTARDGLNALAVVDAVMRSAETGCAVELYH